MRLLDSIANWLGYEKKRRVHACGHNHHACVPKEQYLELQSENERLREILKDKGAKFI